MSYSSLEACLIDLEKNGHLIRIKEEVDPYLEMAALHLRVYEAKGPALLFENVKGSKFRAASNIFGTLERSKFIFRDTIELVQRLIELKGDPLKALKSPLKNFQVGPGTTYQQIQQDQDRFTFFGAAVFLRAPVLNFRVPFFGRTAENEDDAFEAQITSWLAREPATEECNEFNQARMRLIKQIGGNTYNDPKINENAYAVMTDNGC